MIFIVVSVVVPVLVFVGVPWIIHKLTGRPVTSRTLLTYACLLFFISWYLPSPEIHGQDTAFTTHFLGGGIFSGLLWIYLKRQLKWHMPWYLELTALYVLVSALGVANELFELAVVELGVVAMGLSDTSYDLFANTLGAFVVYFMYAALQSSGKKKRVSEEPDSPTR